MRGRFSRATLWASIVAVVVGLAPASAVVVRGRPAPAPAAVRLPPATTFRDKGMTHEVLGFVTRGHLAFAARTLDLGAISTIAYFAVAADRAGHLVTTSPTGKVASGWAGWTSADMTALIARAHAAKTRVVLSIQRFGWSADGAAESAALLASPAARDRLAVEAADAVVSRGVDGLNVDVEPVPAGHRADFVSLVRRIRSTLDARGPGYRLTFDATGFISNYDIANLTAPGAADAVYIMGYQYRGARTDTAGSTAPLGGRRYDVPITLDRYLALTSPGKVILGAPLYGYEWATATAILHAPPTGLGRTVQFDAAMATSERYGRRYDPVEQVAWTAYQVVACAGCAPTWRQLYFDDARALGAKFGLAKARGLLGAGLWVVGYEGQRPDVTAALRSAFLPAH